MWPPVMLDLHWSTGVVTGQSSDRGCFYVTNINTLGNIVNVCINSAHSHSLSTNVSHSETYILVTMLLITIS